MELKQDDIVILKAEKLLYTGVTLAHYNGKSVFLENAVAGDTVEARVIRINKQYIKAKVVNVLEPSKNRVEPFCPMHSVCGGCTLQCYGYSFLCEQKENIVREALMNVDNNIEFKPIIKSPKTKNYRCKVQYPVSETKVSKRLVAGYYKEKTHEIVNIKYCPSQPSIIDSIAEFIREKWVLGAYIEKTKKGLLKYFTVRISDKTQKLLLTLVLNADSKGFAKKKREIESFVQLLMAEFKNVQGVMVNLNFSHNNKILGNDTILISGDDYIYETLKSDDGYEYKFKIGKDSFFQVNPSCASKLFDVVKSYIKDDSYVLDAYGGVGAIGICANKKARKIVLVEENESAIKYAKENFKINECKNYEVFKGDAKAIFKDFIKNKKHFTHIILDPPRKGSDEESLTSVSKLTDSVIYVSCNPSTLQRDAKYLVSLGYRLKTVQSVDMFPYTYHVESVAYFEK